jgi:uncharacterized membrane protein YfhO
VIRVSARSAGFLVLSDLFYPGWVARLDGRLVKIYRADYLLRAVGVPPGEHVVEFEYACPSFGFGAAVSVAAGGLVICCFYYLLWATLSERRRSRER